MTSEKTYQHWQAIDKVKVFINFHPPPVPSVCIPSVFAFQLQKAVRADGNVEVWLMQLMKQAHYSLHCVIRTASIHIQDPAFQILEFLNIFPAQVS